MLVLIFSNILSLIIYFLVQVPRNIPSPANNEPLVLDTPFDYILVIGMPILIAIGYFYWRKKKKEEMKDQ